MGAGIGRAGLTPGAAEGVFPMDTPGSTTVDLLVTGARFLNVFTGGCHEGSVAIADGRVVGFGDYPSRATLDLRGLTLLPGFCEGHIHLESSMLSPAAFAAVAVPHGTTTVVADPHEICNVLGMDGAAYLLETMPTDLLDLYLMAPSCVPATHLETAGAALGVTEIAEMLTWPRVLGLGEVMNYPGVVAGMPEVLAKLEAARGRPIDGHAPGLSGLDLVAYAAAGIESDHECTTLAEAEEKLGLGMWIMIREGSASRNLQALFPLLSGPGRERCLLVSDDLCADDLCAHGHLDEVLRRAVGAGVAPLDAIRAVTLNVAARFRLPRVGALAPGYAADVVAVDDLADFRVRAVLKAGKLVAREGELVAGEPARPRHLGETVHCPTLLPAQLAITAPVGTGARCRVKVIGVEDGQIVTRTNAATLPVDTLGQVMPDPHQEVLKLVVVERHGRNGQIGLAFVSGFGPMRGALASTVAHDSHNLIAVGADDQSLLTAIEAVVAMQGGQAAADGEQVLAQLPLPLAGLMSLEPAPTVAALTRQLRDAALALGSTLSHPLMSLSFLALPVIPELKLTDQGLVDVERFELTSLFLE